MSQYSSSGYSCAAQTFGNQFKLVLSAEQMSFTNNWPKKLSTLAGYRLITLCVCPDRLNCIEFTNCWKLLHSNLNARSVLLKHNNNLYNAIRQCPIRLSLCPLWWNTIFEWWWKYLSINIGESKRCVAPSERCRCCGGNGENEFFRCRHRCLNN